MSYNQTKDIVNGDWKYSLVDNVIYIHRDELIDYHKRDYMWIEKDKFIFDEASKAQKMFNIFSEMKEHGRKESKSEIKKALGL